jgi:hypothetical protein
MRHVLQGLIAVMLVLPAGCATDDATTGDDNPEESTATEKLSASFLQSCGSGSSFHESIDTSTMRLFIDSAVGINCKRTSGPPNPRTTFSGRCFNDLSNRNGVLTCAGG